LALQLGCLVGSDTSRDDSPGHTARTTESDLGRNEDVRNVLIFAKEWKMEQNLQGSSVGSKDNKLRDTAIESLGSYKSSGSIS
jgi:hypothetical protein